MSGLLDQLATVCHCQYISDLPCLSTPSFAPSAILELDEKTYSLDKWNDALEYVLKVPVKVRSAGEAKLKLVEHFFSS